MNTIDALAYSSAGVCEYGRTVTLTSDQDAQPCRGHADQLLTIATDAGDLALSLCSPHKAGICQLTRAEEITTVVNASADQ